jgi:orotidine-5'-phosphate decarboxylase
MDSRGPLCVGIDPHPNLLQAWGLSDDADGLRTFSLTVLEAVAGQVAAVKPQSAFFERFGSAGIKVLEEVLQAAKELDTLSILDVKRGDIGSTMAGYAQAYLDNNSPLAADAITLAPYLGFDSLGPALDMALANGRGVFVLCLTSNPEGASVQHARNLETGQSVAAEIAASAAKWNSTNRAESQGLAPHVIASVAKQSSSDGTIPLGSIGLVVGATIGDAVAVTGTDLAAVNGPLLAPGVGAQGATAADLQRVFGSARGNVLASSSRAILNAGPDVATIRKTALLATQTAAVALR